MFALVLIDESRCKGCGLCTAACPRMLLTLTEEPAEGGHCTSFVSSPGKCVGCALCAVMCPDMAIEVHTRQKNEYTGRTSAVFLRYSSNLSKHPL